MGSYPEVILNDVKIHTISLADFFDYIKHAIDTGRGGIINNVNIHAMNIAWRDPDFRQILNDSDLVFLDGAGVKLGALLVGKTLGERMTMADWGWELFERCSKNGWPVFWLGDTDEVGEAYERMLRSKYPNLVFAGRHHGFFAKTGAENDAVVELINNSGAKVLLVGMSMPIQEKWIWANRDRLKPPVSLAVGAVARFMIGNIRRAPPWMTRNGLEWLHRLLMQPGHTWRRYVIGNPLFMWHVFGWTFFGLKPKGRTK